MPSVAVRINAVVDAHTAQRARVDRSIRPFVTRTVGTFDDWHSTSAITAMATSLSSRIEAAQRTTAIGTNAYLARVSSVVSRRTIRPASIIDVKNLRMGTSHDGVYGRLSNQFRFHESQGMDTADNMSGVIARAMSMLDTDLQLAMTHQSRAFTEKSKATGYRRIIRPEMSSTGTCGLCVVSADQIYGSDVLMPIHNSCNCDVLPIIGDEDPGATLNREELDSLYSDAGGTNAENLLSTRYAVEEHGELGPVLVNADHQFKGKGDL